MTHEPNAVVIVGAGAAQQRFDDPALAVEAGALMRLALERAADDAGSRALLDAGDVLLMPRGTWPYANPAAIVAPWNPALRSIVADIGVLQQTLLSRACAMVADGSADVALVCGGETKYRALRAQIAGTLTTDTATHGTPTERLEPAHEILTTEEIARGLPVPARQYAIIDTALRRAQGLSPAGHVELLAQLWAGFSAVSARNPDAWSRTEIAPSALSEPSTANPMLAWPYTKLHCSQWNVDQAAGLIICSAATAERHGIPRDRWVFAHTGVESNLMVPLTRRADLHRSPAVAGVGEAIRQHCRIAPADVAHLDIYSCFPAAVRVQMAELGLTGHRPLTVTGGMTFAGGPLNNYTLQAVATMVGVLRADPAAQGLVTNVSGMLTKFGASLWSCAPPAQPFAAIDVTGDAAAATALAQVDPSFRGRAQTLSYTVACDKGTAAQGIVIGETPSGARCLVTTTDAELMADMMQNDWCGRSIDVDGAALIGTGA